jgi:cell wall-associated NlpC family hydrolase
VPSALISALAAQIREVQSLVGPGWSSDPTTDPASMLVGAQVALAEVSAAAGRAWNRASEHWSGTGAEGAAEFAASTVATANALAARVDQLGATAQTAGLDCSGLTQWAYHEAGLNIPRLAQEQDIGAAVDAGSLRPGDLAVWDGHVAIIVGNGTMIEAGDPVHLSPIRTDNAGQGFQGFWRPTA